MKVKFLARLEKCFNVRVWQMPWVQELVVISDVPWLVPAVTCQWTAAAPDKDMSFFRLFVTARTLDLSTVFLCVTLKSGTSAAERSVFVFSGNWLLDLNLCCLSLLLSIQIAAFDARLVHRH